MLLAVSVLALGQEPVARVEEDGAVEVRCTVAASPESVRAVLSDPVRSGQLSPEVVTVTPHARGDCVVIDTTVRSGPFDDLEYRALRCPTADGWKETLVRSDDLSVYEAQWSVYPSGTGAEVVYRVRTEVQLPVPRAIVRRGILRSATEALRQLVRELGR